MDDRHFMRQALKLAGMGVGNTSPNPMVGALVVDASGAVVGRGYHECAGSDHAEVVALREAGDRARGATLYLTLEPCVHQGQTPPCAPVIAKAGIKRVVCAMEDPDPRVRGRGLAYLREHGMEVVTGMEADRAQHLNRMYIHHRTTGRPYVTLKMAQSLDGAVAVRPGERRQLSGPRAMRFVRSLRYEHDAVMVGSGTVRTDDPRLTVRPYRRRAVSYRRIVVDARCAVDLRAQVFKDQKRAQTIVATTEQMPAEVASALTSRSVQVLSCRATPQGRVDLVDLLTKLGSMNILSVLCEGGPTLAAAMLEAGLVCTIHLIVAPLFIPDADAVRVLAPGPVDIGLAWDKVARLGEDLVITGRPHAVSEGSLDTPARDSE